MGVYLEPFQQSSLDGHYQMLGVGTGEFICQDAVDSFKNVGICYIFWVFKAFLRV